MEIGIESIHKQTNILFINKINKIINNVQDTMRVNIKDDVSDKHLTYQRLDKYKKVITRNMLEKDLSEISSILTDRFGFNITIRNLTMKDFKLSSLIMPILNYKTTNIALNSIDDLFPNKQNNQVLWESKASTMEHSLYNTLNSVKEAIRKDNFNIDLKNATVNGLVNSDFIINIDFIRTLILRASAEEVTSLIISEVGRIFAYLEYMTTTTNASFKLIDTFINERFTKNKSPIESISISMSKVDKTIQPKNATETVAVLEDLNSYILNTYRINNTKGSIQIDYQRSADVFAIRFGLATELTAVLAKRASSGIVSINESNEYESVGSEFIRTLSTMIAVTVFVFTMMLLLLVGVLIFVGVFVYTMIQILLGVAFNTVLSTFLMLFKNNNYKKFTYDDIFTRLDKIKLELIHSLRSIESTDEDKQLLVKQIDEIKDTLSLLKRNMRNLNKYGYIDITKNNTVNDLVELLEDNDLYYYSNKFKGL